MKKILVALVSVIMASCSNGVGTIYVLAAPGNVMYPGTSLEAQTQFATALSCDVTKLQWSLYEAGNAGFTSPFDGAVTSAGVYSAPQCGSVYIGTTVHLVAICPTNGNNAVAELAISQDLLSVVDIAYAIVDPGLPTACVAKDPLHVVSTSLQRVQLYTKLTFTCGSAYTPALPSPLPAVCP